MKMSVYVPKVVCASFGQNHVIMFLDNLLPSAQQHSVLYDIAKFTA